MLTRKRIIRICSAVIGISGLVILFSTFYPLASYEWESGVKYPTLLSPLVEEKDGVKMSDADYTHASNWFVGGAKKEDFGAQNVSYFIISIPRLKIENATVSVGGDDLSKSLVQYPGTAPPGKTGNTVIFGHSILPIFYNPKNYMSIFSTLPTLKKGDDMSINYDGVTYKYRVDVMFEVTPSDIQVLDQDASDSFLTLVTCVPPGDPRKPKRLIVRARLVPLEQANVNTRN
jgi:sortase A